MNVDCPTLAALLHYESNMGVVWRDWLTESFFRVRIATVAAEKLASLPEETQIRLRHMLNEIAELADGQPRTSAQAWRATPKNPLLQLQLGRVTVRYSSSEESRTLSVEHVIVPAHEPGLDQVG